MKASNMKPFSGVSELPVRMIVMADMKDAAIGTTKQAGSIAAKTALFLRTFRSSFLKN